MVVGKALASGEGLTGEDKDLYKLVREALQPNYSSYKGFLVVKRWESHHAQFAHVSLKAKKTRLTIQKDLVVKQFVPMEGVHEPVYAMAHSQDFLYGRELRNLKLIRQVISAGAGRNVGSKMVPFVEGSIPHEHMIMMHYLSGANRKQELLAARTDEKSYKTFLDGLKYVARFDGLCNAFETEFNRLYDFEKEKDLFLSATKGLFKENLVRGVYNLDLACATKVGEYNYDSVCDYVQKDKGINLEERLREIFSLESQLQRATKLQHRDCNGLNMIGERLIDLEDFGYGSFTDDISSYCIIVGKGNNTIFKNKDFSYFLQAYIALEHAYEQKDWDRAASLMKATNGQFKDRVSEIMSEQQYADFLLSFFADAIGKNVQLGSSFSRYDPKLSAGLRGTTQKSVKELFENVSLLDRWFNSSSNPTEAREYFYAVGNLLNQLGFSEIDNSTLYRIRKSVDGTIARNLDENNPFRS